MNHHLPNIRLAKSSDIPTLVKFNQAMALETENKELVPNTVEKGVSAVIANNSLGFYMVAERNGEILGSLMITTEWSDWRAAQFWWIQSVYVDTRFRRQNVFRQLFNEIKNLASQNKEVYGIRLYVEKNNSVAQQTYESLGMEKSHYRLFEIETN